MAVHHHLCINHPCFYCQIHWTCKFWTVQYSTPLRQLCLTSWHGRLGLKQCKKQNEEQEEFTLPKPVVALWSTVDHHLLQFPLNIGQWETFLLFSSLSHGVVLHIYYLFPRICYLYVELNNNTAHRTHNNTVSWFIPLQSDSQTLTKLDEKTSKENPRSQYFYDSSSSSLLSTHVLITLFGSPSPNLVVLLNVTKLWGVGLVKLSYNVNLCSCEARHPFQWFPAAITRLFHTCGWSGVTWKIQHPAIQGAFPSAYKSSHHGKGLHCSLLCCAQMYDIP